MKAKQYKYTVKDIADILSGFDLKQMEAKVRRDIKDGIFNPEKLGSVAEYIVAVRLKGMAGLW